MIKDIRSLQSSLPPHQEGVESPICVNSGHWLWQAKIATGVVAVLECRSQTKRGGSKSGCFALALKELRFLLRTSIPSTHPDFHSRVEKAKHEVATLQQIELWRSENPNRFRHIISTYGFWENKHYKSPTHQYYKQRFYTLQEAARGDLCDLMEKGYFQNSAHPQRAARQLLSIAHQSLEGLAALHEHGVIHHDIKPDNLLYRKEGKSIQVFIADMDLTDTLETARQRLRQGLCGTPCMIDPEMAKMESLSAVNFLIDSWALGLSLVELSVGVHVPWMHSDSLITVRNIRALNQSTVDSFVSRIPRYITDTEEGKQLIGIIRLLVRVKQSERKPPAEILTMVPAAGPSKPEGHCTLL